MPDGKALASSVGRHGPLHEDVSSFDRLAAARRGAWRASTRPGFSACSRRSAASPQASGPTLSSSIET